MRHASVGFLASLRLALRATLLVLASIALIGVTTLAAEANSKYAAIVIDANTGKTLFAANADVSRYPASLTKMMTLYMVFEAMQSGRIGKQTQVPFSRHAASMPPTKLGVRAGRSIPVETAILSLVTKSANDAAAALGELLGGTEANFARMMTAKARRLGMNSTTFRNASGLPDPRQRTTARDMAILGIALREHFPRQYAYFSTRSFTYGKQRLGNHNKLLGRVQGVDGIKTGYTRASGFNLVSSMRNGKQSVVAVVMGGKSGPSRDAHMKELLRKYAGKASTRKGGALVAARVIEPQPAPVVAAVAPVPPVVEAPVEVARPQEEIAVAQPQEEVVVAAARFAPEIEAEGDAPSELDAVSTASIASGWAVQVGSLASEAEARAFLGKTAEKAGKLLATAEPFTVTFAKDGTTYYRARYGGFASKSAAWDACGALKKRKIDCYAVQQ